MSLARRALLVALWLAAALIVAYQSGLAIIGIFVFHSRASGLATLVLSSPLLYIPALAIAAYRLRTGVYVCWAAFAICHAALFAIAWPHVAAVVLDLTLDWELLLVSAMLTVLLCLEPRADADAPALPTNPHAF